MEKKRLLLLGGGHAEIPLIKAAQALGYFVITTGNASEGLGHPIADKNVFEDFSNKDAMLELARRENVNAVCSGCNDFALLSTAYVCEKLGLPGHDSYATSLQLHHKDKYRALAMRLGIPTPLSLCVKSREDLDSCFYGGEKNQKLCFPVIVKPIDLTGGKGICTAENYEEVVAAYESAINYTREDHVVVEEFVIGTNHGFSAMLVSGKVVFYFADNEQYFINPYMVSGANTPSTTSHHGLKLLCEYSERIASDLHLVDGILHIQYIERCDGTPIIIEICRRPPGDLYIQFVQYASAVNYPRAIILAELGKLQVSDLNSCGNIKPFLRHCVMATREGIVQDVYFDPEIAINIVDKFMWFKKGEHTGNILYYKAGIVFMQFESEQEMVDKTSRMTELIKVII